MSSAILTGAVMGGAAVGALTTVINATGLSIADGIVGGAVVAAVSWVNFRVAGCIGCVVARSVGLSLDAGVGVATFLAISAFALVGKALHTRIASVQREQPLNERDYADA